MDFGKLEDISNIDFALPADNRQTAITLEANKTEEETRFYIGPPIWANPEWLGVIYPTNAKDKDLLYYYSRQFNTIELNVTHYQIPSHETIKRWKEAVPENFTFCPKFPQIISHERQLIGCEAQTDEFCEAILQLENNLGISFLQLSPYFQPRQRRNLEMFLKRLPQKLPIAVEFRHPDWFTNQNFWQDTVQMLRDLEVSTVITDVSGRRDVLHQSLSKSTLVLRFVGNSLHRTDYTRADEWISKVAEWMQKGLHSAFIFIHCGGTNDFAPELTHYWINNINKQCSTHLSLPKISPRVVQGSLF